MQYALSITYQNWQKIEHQGLYDYKEDSIKIKSVPKITNPGLIYRKIDNFDLKFIPSPELPDNGQLEGYEPLASIHKNQNNYKITDIRNSEEPLSVIVSSHIKQGNKQEGQNLQQGNILKIGKASIKILKLKLNKNGLSHIESPKIKTTKITKAEYKPRLSIYSQQEQKDNKQQLQHFKDLESLQSTTSFSIVQSNPTCRICYSKTITQQNSILTLCKCSGSSKFVHEKCLVQWLLTKGQLKQIQGKNCSEKALYCVSLKNFECQLCRTQFPFQQILELFAKHNYKQNDINLLNLASMKNIIAFSANCQQKSSIYIANLDNISCISIGRSTSSSIFFPDLSISRNHCQIIYNGQSVKVRDCESKFGTLIKKPSIIIKSKILQLQKGRTKLIINQEKVKKNIWSRISMSMCSA